jgi:hypothetical protein
VAKRTATQAGDAGEADAGTAGAETPREKPPKPLRVATVAMPCLAGAGALALLAAFLPR